MDCDKKLTFFGNSQLQSSILAQYCQEEVLQEINKVQLSKSNYYSGNFHTSGYHCHFVTGNITFFGKSYIDYKAKQVRTTRQFSDVVDELIEYGSPIVLMLRGNEVALQSIVDYPPRWDFSTEAFPAEIGRQFVDIEHVKASFLQDLQNLISSCAHVKIKSRHLPVYYVPPPPIGGDAVIQSNPEIFGRLIEAYGIKPAKIRKKIYDLMYDLICKNISNLGIEIIHTPDDCIAVDGTLKQEFAHGCLHGNSKYGQLLMEKIIRVIDIKDTNDASL